MSPEEPVVIQNDGSIKKGRPCIGKSILEIILLVLAILFLTAAIVLIVLYFTQAKPEDVCTSPKCFISVGGIFKKMDPTVNPCDNFADYACGGFYRDAVIPNGLETISAFTELRENSGDIIEDVLDEPIAENDEEYLKKAKTFYLSCSDEETIGKLGASPYHNTSFPKDWPSLNKNWDPASFDLKKALGKYAPLTPLPFFHISVAPDLMDSFKNTIYMTVPRFVRDISKEMNRSINPSHVNCMTLTLKLGAGATLAWKDCDDCVKILKKLSNPKIMHDDEVQRNMSALYNPVALKDMATQFPSIDFKNILQAFFQGTGITLQNDQKIIIDNPKYFKHLGSVIQATDPRIIQNVIGYSYANHVVTGLSKEYRMEQKVFQMNDDLVAVNHPKDCLISSLVFGKALGKEFVKRASSEELKSTIITIFDAVDKSFIEMLKDTKWLGEETKKEALFKIKNMVRKIGYPESNYSESDINEYYESVSFTDSYYQNEINMYKFQRIKNMQELTKPADKYKWQREPFQVNAYYANEHNEIVVPAGIMQLPFYSDIFPASITYGGIGSLIGHAISHAFDATGIQFDHSGNLKNRWQERDFEEFRDRGKCVIDQYSNFEHPQVKMKLNGNLSLRENIADMSAVNQAFRAYKSSGTRSNEKPLPGLDLTTEQQFFLAFSQMWCEKGTNESLRKSILLGNHSPGRFRIIGSLQNSKEFAKAFNCPVGSYMNPSEKCVIW